MPYPLIEDTPDDFPDSESHRCDGGAEPPNDPLDDFPLDAFDSHSMITSSGRTRCELCHAASTAAL